MTSWSQIVRLNCLLLVWVYSGLHCHAKEEVKVVAGNEYVRDTSVFDSKIETERHVDDALRSLIELIASKRLKFFGRDHRPGNSLDAVLTPASCERLVAPAIDKLKTPEQLVSFAAVCRTKTALYGRYDNDGVGMLYEAAYCRALENLVKNPSDQAERLMSELPNMFVYDGASAFYFEQKLELLRARSKLKSRAVSTQGKFLSAPK